MNNHDKGLSLLKWFYVIAFGLLFFLPLLADLIW